MRSPPGILALGLTVCLLAGAGGGCALQSSRRTLTTAPPAPTLDGRPAFMKAHLKDGSLLVFSDWRVDEPTGRLLGMAERFNLNRTSVASGPMSVPLDSLAICEANVLQASPAVAGLTILSVATAGMTAYCLSDPKACFGSCPTFYAPNEDGAPLLQAEGFSASIAPSLEAGDLDQLTRCRAKGRRFELAMTNEALETHVVRYVELLAVPRAPGGRVFATATGDFHATTAPMAPIHATAIEGDVTALLAAADGRERFSLADGADLAAREIIDLTFDAPPAGRLGLVLTSRQSLLSTYLFYQGLAFLGDRAAPALAHARQVLEPADGGGTLGGLLGRIAVAVVDTHGVWVAAGSVGETGPLAPNTHLVMVPEGAARPLRVRLELARGCWRLDQATLVQLQGPAAARRLAPMEVRRDGNADPDALARLLDPGQTLVTFPGDRYTLVFDLPTDAADLELFVESRGYYLEWMRREWAADQDPERAARMLFTPAVMLRELAPAFKERESAMEAQFWGSRYAR